MTASETETALVSAARLPGTGRMWPEAARPQARLSSRSWFPFTRSGIAHLKPHITTLDSANPPSGSAGFRDTKLMRQYRLPVTVKGLAWLA